jgi:hypothetical protein
MVGLAKKHQDEPFHVIASYCQRGAKGPTLKFLKTQGWSEELENISVMYQTTYSRDVEITYVPYYLIFDHTGKLRHHHMAGPYHGGNGDLYQEQVAALMKEVPKKEGKEVDLEGALSEVRAWTNLRGRIIEAALLGVGEELAKFRMRNGHTYNYPLGKLSSQSRDEIKRLAAEE